jgi:hypothetical protein
VADTYSIADVLARTEMLEVVCSRCDRGGRLSLRRLAKQYDSSTSMALVLADLTADCPRRKAPSWTDRCDPHSPEMPMLFLV